MYATCPGRATILGFEPLNQNARSPGRNKTAATGLEGFLDRMKAVENFHEG